MSTRPKHLRERWRYLAVEFTTWPDASLDRRTVQGALWRSGRALLGDSGSATAELSLVDFSFERGRGSGIVRTRRGHEDDARAVIACLDAVEDEPVGIRVAGTSGTVRGAREKYLGRHRQPTGERTVVFEDEERSAIVYPDGIDCRLENSFAGATHLDI